MILIRLMAKGALLALLTETAYGAVSCREGAVSKQQIDAWVAQDQPLESAIYVYIDEKFRAQKELANLARVGFLKALFHTSALPQIAGFADISDQHCAVYRVDLTKVWGARWQEKWQMVSGNEPGPNVELDPSWQRFPKMSQAELVDASSKKLISASRLAYNITYPSNYIHLTDSPDHIRDLNSGRNLAVGAIKDAIPCGPRTMVARKFNYNGHESTFFITADPSNVQGDQESEADIPSSPRDLRRSLPAPSYRRISGSEAYHTLPNGFLRYFIFRNPGSLGTKAIRSGVIDPINIAGGHALVAGRSCISCHSNGVRGAPLDTYDKSDAGWSTSEQWQSFLVPARDGFRKAMQTLVDQVSNGSQQWNQRLVFGATREPIAMLIAEVDGVSVANPPRRYRFNGRCMVNGENKFARQIEGIKQQQLAEQQDRDTGVPVLPPSQPVKTGPGAEAPGVSTDNSSIRVPVGAHAEVFRTNCANSGCHSLAATDARLRKPVPASMWFIAGTAALTEDSEAAQQIKIYLQQTIQSIALTRKDIGSQSQGEQ